MGSRRPPPFSLRLTFEERAKIEADAAGMSLGGYTVAMIVAAHAALISSMFQVLRYCARLSPSSISRLSMRGSSRVSLGGVWLIGSMTGSSAARLS